MLNPPYYYLQITYLVFNLDDSHDIFPNIMNMAVVVDMALNLQRSLAHSLMLFY